MNKKDWGLMEINLVLPEADIKGLHFKDCLLSGA